MEERRTHIRRDEDQERHKADNCFFYREKGTYEQMIKEQQTLNSAIMDMLTSLNDNLQEYKEAGSEENRQILDQVHIHVNGLIEQIRETDERDILQNTQIQEIFAALQELRSYVNMQMDDGTKAEERINKLDRKLTNLCKELASLKEHLDNGYSDKLVSRITAENEKTADKSTDKMTERMMGMVEDMLRGKIKWKENRQRYFWTWLIRLTAVGGIGYMLVDLIVKKWLK